MNKVNNLNDQRSDLLSKIGLIVGGAFVIYAVFIDTTLIGLFGLFCLVWLFNNFDKIQYRRGALKNELRIPTSKDNFPKTMNYVIGGILCLVSVLYFVWNQKFDQFVVFGAVGGILVFLNGFLDLPKGILRFDGNLLKIIDKVNNVEEDLEWNQVQAIEIRGDQLIFDQHLRDRFIKTDLLIDNKIAQTIEAFMNRHLKSDSFSVKNNV